MTSSTDSEHAEEPDVLAPWGTDGPPAPGAWVEDVLGDGFQAYTLPLLDDEEGEAVATLVRHLPASDPVFTEGNTPWLPLPLTRPDTRATLLYLHGRNDYFFQVEMARELSAMGIAFYALDLRKYGRSLRPHQTIGWTDDLTVYDEEIGAALRLVRSDHPDLPLFLMGHSTGGLIGVLWAYRHPGTLRGLILNSAWLELQTMAQVRPAMQQIVAAVATKRPRAVISSSKSDVYGRSLREGWAGSGLGIPEQLRECPDDPAVCGWDFFTEWKRLNSYPVPAGWLQAIMAAQEEVAQRVALDCPVLSFASTSSADEAGMSERIFSSDIVLDADLIAERSVRIGDLVTIARLPGKHDLTLSDPDVRQKLYTIVDHWLGAVLRPEDLTAGRNRD